jgi:hypothetical protein
VVAVLRGFSCHLCSPFWRRSVRRATNSSSTFCATFSLYAFCALCVLCVLGRTL